MSGIALRQFSLRQILGLFLAVGLCLSALLWFFDRQPVIQTEYAHFGRGLAKVVHSWTPRHGAHRLVLVQDFDSALSFHHEPYINGSRGDFDIEIIRHGVFAGNERVSNWDRSGVIVVFGPPDQPLQWREIEVPEDVFVAAHVGSDGQLQGLDDYLREYKY